jgi:hypothetical protein
MYLTTVKELGTALLTKGTAFALTQTATQTNNSSVNDVLDSAQEVTASTADEVNRFVQYFNDNIPNLIAFGLKVIFAIVFYLIGSKVISVIRKVVGKSMERSNADVGVRQFVDSMLKFGLYALLIFMIATKFGVESSSVAAIIASAAVAVIDLDEQVTTLQLKRLMRDTIAVRELHHMIPIFDIEFDFGVPAIPFRIMLQAENFKKELVEYEVMRRTLMDKRKDEVLTLEDVKAGNATLDELTAQLTVEEMAELCVGTERRNGDGNVIGSASSCVPGAAGDTTSSLLETRKVPNLIQADGPAGLFLLVVLFPLSSLSNFLTHHLIYILSSYLRYNPVFF